MQKNYEGWPTCACNEFLGEATLFMRRGGGGGQSQTPVEKYRESS